MKKLILMSLVIFALVFSSCKKSLRDHYGEKIFRKDLAFYADMSGNYYFYFVKKESPDFDKVEVTNIQYALYNQGDTVNCNR